ncbi:pirin family protein [Sphingomonas sp. DT-51]|uniref:pirin family protein n=1 Tax=Sphingomonas sp. DT-51 TaxID=3396165 RepID=UPI003F1C5B9D
MSTTLNQTDAQATERRIVYHAGGRGHGEIMRLMSPSDLGEHLKPFVFLDLFAGDMRLMQDAMPVHPHSGIATVTVFTEGDVRYDDPEIGSGTLGFGGVEWMRAGGGVWHGKELSAGGSDRMQGFQLWVALPPELENGAVESQYVEASDTPIVGPARLILGTYGDASSTVRAPEGMNYLLVTLEPGERWTYSPPSGHTVGWLAVAKGRIDVGRQVDGGQIVIFEEGEQDVVVHAGDEGASFVIGSAVPHDHELHLGYYSVHTSAEALAAGERRIAELGREMSAAGDRRTDTGNVPVYR